MGKVQTVKGLIQSDDLGITLSHEHLIFDIRFLASKPTASSETELFEWRISEPIPLEYLSRLRINPELCKDNLKSSDVRIAVEELRAFKRAGGNSLVDVTPIGLGRDPQALRSISQDTGVNIICATGWYVKKAHPAYIRDKTIDELSEMLVKELTEGIEGIFPPIKAGVIKVGCSSPRPPTVYQPFQSDEKKVLQAAARAQKETGVPISIHPAHFDEMNKKVVKTAGFEYLNVLQKEGADLEKVYINHMDSYPLTTFITENKLDLDYHRSLMDKYGVTLDFDTFGENYYFHFPYVHPSDRYRVAAVVDLCQQGYDKLIMLSHDIDKKTEMVKYGGPGFAYILDTIVPELRFWGVTQKQISRMLIENQKRMFTI